MSANGVMIGLTGASLVLSYIFHVPSSAILLVFTLLLLVVCCYFLGVDSILKSVVGSLLIPLFVSLTSELPPLQKTPCWLQSMVDWE